MSQFQRTMTSVFLAPLIRNKTVSAIGIVFMDQNTTWGKEMHIKKEIKKYWFNIKVLAESKIREEDLSRHFIKRSPAYSSFVYSERLFPAIQELKNRKSPKVLELGAGLGIDANLFAKYGAEVFAVEIESNRLQIFRQLRNHLNSKDLHIVERDALSWLSELDKKQKFDLIWITEAISHIHPLETLFKLLRDKLNNDGVVIISESNINNPVFKKYIDKERLDRYARKELDPDEHMDGDIYLTPSEYIDPKTGKKIFQANERMLSPGELRRLMRIYGFKQKKTYYRMFLPEKIFTLLPLSWVLEKILSYIPALRTIGVRYISLFEGA